MKRLAIHPSSRAAAVRSNLLESWDCFVAVVLAMTLLISCAPINVSAPALSIRVNADTGKWASIPAGEFHHGQFDEIATVDHDYEMMAYLVTNQQYAAFLNSALTDGKVKVDGDQIVGFYAGDEFNGVKHEEKIKAGDWIYIPLNDLSLRLDFDGTKLTVQPSWEWHPMTMVSWFGARAYCEYNGWRLPTEMEWEKAARGTDVRPFPWGDEIQRENANFYSSRDPFEDMSSFGSRTTPVGFYNGQKYGDFQTLDSASPYGLYDMAGDVWQWTGDVYEGMHYRFLRGGSKDTYDMDLRIWVRNNATPTYVSPGVGFRCAR